MMIADNTRPRRWSPDLGQNVSFVDREEDRLASLVVPYHEQRRLPAGTTGTLDATERDAASGGNVEQNVTSHRQEIRRDCA